MSDKETKSIELEPSSSALNKASRRKFFKKAAVGSALITSIAAKPVWGGNDNCTVSGMISGNLSHDVNNDHYNCSGYGFSPGGWKNSSGHPSRFPEPFIRSTSTLADVNTLITDNGGTVLIQDKFGVPLTTLLQTCLESNDIEKRLVQGILNTVAFAESWYVIGGIYPKKHEDPGSTFYNMPVNGEPFEFLQAWPYGLEDVVESYNSGNYAVLNDIAANEF